MITYNILMEAIAWITICYFVINLSFHFGIYFGGLINKTPYWSIDKMSMIAKADALYIIPTIAVSVNSGVEIIFYWLNYQWYICYNINKNES